MTDLSKHPCPWCGVPDPIINEMPNGTDYLECRRCALRILGRDDHEESAADAWKELSEKVHGKPHDGPMVDVRIAVAVDAGGGWGMEPIIGDHSAAAFHAAGEGLFGSHVCHIITATLPLPVAKEIKGRVE